MIVGVAIRSFGKTRDPLSPAIIFAPMLLYMYAYSPLMLSRSEDLYEMLTARQLAYVQFLNLCGVTAFLAGCMAFGRLPWRLDKHTLNQSMQVDLAPHGKQAIFRLACLLGLIGTGSFLYCVEYSGGWIKVFSQGKPYIGGPSGYVSEAQLLCFPAIVLLGLSLQGRRLKPRYLALVLFFALPHLTIATLGGRRGPAFMLIAVLALSYFLYRGVRPKLKVVIIGLVLTGMLMLFLVSNRRNIHLGSDFDFESEAFVQALTVTESARGNEYAFAAGLILTTDYHFGYGFGRRYIFLLLVRPIPRAIWPTKYRDVGVEHWVTNPGTGGFTNSQWIEAVGYTPLRGSAGGFVADLYTDFWWFALVVLYYLGRLYARVWRGWVTKGGFYTLAYLQMLALSIFLPSQSLNAWGVRLLLLVVPTYILWRWLIVPVQRRYAALKRAQQHQDELPQEEVRQMSWIGGPST